MTRDRANYLCVERLARLLYERVDCALVGKKRAYIDWTTAEIYLRGHPNVVNAVVDGCSSDSFDSDAFEQMYGEHIYREAFLPMIWAGDLPRPPYGSLR